MKNQQILLSRRPRSKGVASADVDLVETECAEPAPGQVRVRVIYLSIDPTIRLWLNQTPPVVAAIPLGSVVPCLGLGIVDVSHCPDLPVGTPVTGMLGWQSQCTCAGRLLQHVRPVPGLPLTAHLSVLGPTGLTAYFGLLELGRPEPGDTLVVSAAAGAVGSLVGQIGKLHDCRVVGIAGGADKCRYLLRELGFDDAIDYRRGNLAGQLALLTPQGVDIYFDNVGGDIREAVIPAMKDGGRVVVCGEIASAYTDNRGTGIRNSFQIIEKALQLRGLRVDRYYARAGEAIPRLAHWASSGRLHWPTQLLKELENAPKALNMLFDGDNRGKVIVQISAPPRL